MNTYDKLSRLYQRWLQRNKLNPLISADDLYYDYCRGEVSLDNGQLSWLKRFNEVWWKAEHHESDKAMTIEEKNYEIWAEYMSHDKRGFDEFFSYEFGITINEDINPKQLRFLCETLIPHAKTYYGGNNG